MPVVVFSHSDLSDLAIHTGADDIEWSYGLNYVTYPTYGGEVVQILSTYIDDLTISGTAATYAELARIYAWFLDYIQIASQGRGYNSVKAESQGYSEVPITFSYPERGWQMPVKLTQLPGYRLATDVVACPWQITCRVIEDDPKVQALTMANADASLGQFGKMNASIGSGDPAANPFSNPFPDKLKVDPQKRSDAFKQVGDYYTGLISSYGSGDFSSLFGSGPIPFLNPTRTGPTQTNTTTPKK